MKVLVLKLRKTAARTAGLLVALLTAGVSPAAPLSTPANAPIRWEQIGAKAGAEYHGKGLSVTRTVTGAKLNCIFQRLEGEATPAGLWLASAETNQAPDRFRVTAVAVGRATAAAVPDVAKAWRPARRLSCVGDVSINGQTVRFTRPGLVEEYSVSMDGVRQDFVVLEKPTLNSPGELRLELAVTGARVEQTADGAHLVLASGRKIAYSRLRVTDADGKELPARIEVTSSSPHRTPLTAMTVVVDNSNAHYPIRIDPTFSDANWISMGGLPGANDEVYAAAMDSSGNLYIGGSFTLVGGVFANRIAKWNGSSWSALGEGMNGEVAALAVLGSEVYAGGSFTTAGGIAATNIAKWDGSSWSALGSGMNFQVNALAVSGSDVYAGGQFTTAGGVAADRIAKWNGSNWSALGSGISGDVWALAVSGSNVYAGGWFTLAGGIGANSIAKWNGSSWSALGSGIINKPVLALAVSGSNVYAGGDFTTAGGSAANNIAKWNGNSWSTLGSGMNNSVSALAVSGSDVYAGGYFTTAGGIAAKYIAKWNGNSWSPLGSGMNSFVWALAVSGGDVYVGGSFGTAGKKVSAYVARAVLGDAPGYNRIAGQSLPGGAMQLSYVGYPATNYALERTFNLSPPVGWEAQATNTMSISGVLNFTNTPIVSTNNFWRVRVVP